MQALAQKYRHEGQAMGDVGFVCNHSGYVWQCHLGRNHVFQGVQSCAVCLENAVVGNDFFRHLQATICHQAGNLACFLVVTTAFELVGNNFANKACLRECLST